MLFATHSSPLHRYATDGVTPTDSLISTALYVMPTRKCERAMWPNENTFTTTALEPDFSAIVSSSSDTVYSSASPSTPEANCSVATPSTSAAGAILPSLSTIVFAAFR